ncbi:hypothetical protein BAE46_11905 [Glaciecola punicea]|nr:hypothetical protein BAE46_11905 [Glaciecola punicea]
MVKNTPLKFDEAMEAKRDQGCRTVPAVKPTNGRAVFSVTRADTKNLHLYTPLINNNHKR